MIKRIVLALLLSFAIAGSLSAQEVVATLPEHLQPITPDNADQLQEVARIGNGVFNRGIAYSPDGATLVVGGSLGIWLYDANDLYAPPTLIDLDAPVYDVEFSHDGRYLVYGVNNSIHVLDFATRETVLTLEDAQQFAIAPDSEKIAVGRSDRGNQPPYSSLPYVQIIDIDSGIRVEVLDFRSQAKMRGYVSDLAFSPNGNLLAVSVSDFAFDTCGNVDAIVALFDLAQVLQQAPTILPSSNRIAFDRDGSLIAAIERSQYGFNDGPLIIWDVVTGERQFVLQGSPPNGGVAYQDYRFNTDGEYLTATGYNRLLRWNVNSGELVNDIRISDEPYYRDHIVSAYDMGSLTYSPNGNQIAIATPISVQIWEANLASHTEILLEGATAYAQVHPSSSLVTVRDNEQQTRAWVVDTTEVVEHTIPTQGDELYFSDNGSVFARLTSDDQIQLWNLNSGAQISTLEGEFPFDWYAQFSPDSSMIVTWQIEQLENNERRILLGLWDVATGTLIGDLGTYPHVEEVVFSADSEHIGIVYATDSSFGAQQDLMSRIVDVPTGTFLFERSHYGDDGYFSSDMSVLVEDRSDWTNIALHVFDVQTGEEVIPNGIFLGGSMAISQVLVPMKHSF